MFEERTAAYLEAVDDALPGFVSGLYLVGSAALGAWQPGHSDIDMLIFTSRVPARSDLAALRELHAEIGGKPYLDGVYVSPEDDWPADNRVAPFVVNGQLHTDRRCGELNPAVWLTLQRYGIPVRGPAARDLGVRVDLDALRAYSLDNLRTYWQAQAAQISSHGADLDPATDVDAEIVTWVVLGPARLHYTLAAVDITSKTAAGEYVMARFPEYASLAERAIRWRADGTGTFSAEDLGAAASLTNLVADDAWKRWG
jgi:hypothetical protein